MGRQPRATSADAALRDLADGRGQRRVLGRPVQRGRRRARRRHRAHAAPHREPDAVPAAARPGLRRSPGKAFCTVLDFVGHAPPGVPLRPPLPGAARRHPPGRSSAAVAAAVPVPARRLPHAARPEGRRDRAAQPAGGHPVALAEQGRRAALAAPRRDPTSTWPGSSTSPASSSTTSTTAAKCWSDLREAAGAARPAPPARTRRELRRAVGRLLHIDDHERIATYQRLLADRDGAADVDAMPERERRLAPHARRRRSPTGRSPRTPRCRRRSTSSGPTRRCGPSCCSSSPCSTRGSTTSTPRSPRIPTCPLQVHARYTRIEILAAFGIGDRRQDRRLAERRLRGQGRQRRAVRLHARQDQRRLLPDHPLPRLRHQPHPHPLGEPVDHPSRQRHRPPLPQPRARRPLDHALHPPPSRRPSLLVPRPRPLPPPRRREAHGHHLGARPPAPGRPVRVAAAVG